VEELFMQCCHTLCIELLVSEPCIVCARDYHSATITTIYTVSSNKCKNEPI